MRTSEWVSIALLYGALNLSLLQAAPIGPRTTGSVGILTASGEASYRVGTGGSCGFGPIGDPYPDSAIASIRSTSAIVAQLPESGCGACIEITCADQGVCNADASPVTFTVVDCTPPGNLEIHVLEYRPSSGGYLKITPWQTAGLATVAKIEYKQSGAADLTYQTFRNTYGAVWEASNLPPSPLDIRLTDPAGHSVVASQITPTAAADIPTGVQFPLTVQSLAVSPPVTPSPAAVPVSPIPSPVFPSPSPPPVVAPLASPPLAAVPASPPLVLSPIPLVPVGSPVQASPPVVAIPMAVAPVVPPPAQPPASLPLLPPSPAPVVSPPVVPIAPVVAPLAPSPAIPPSPTGPCQNVLQILQSNPQLSTWLSILQDLGQAASLGNDRLNITMFAPLSSAFNAPIPAGSSLGNGTVGQLLNSRPALKSPVAGYHVVAGAFPSSALTPGTILPTVDVERTPGQPDRPVILNVTAPLKLQGVGSSANIVQPDLKTCGPSVVHVIDAVLLPFSPTTGPAAGGRR
ncbi:hypothetical protein WJX75_003217 [Coccomyxa subellipsoidea]|uniref:FAS1 domain-containing protein n=1 Tax=Coccomyxa subellipsoidea TaxID=248742 RepID=A0ABR2YXW2_9CHLO